MLETNASAVTQPFADPVERSHRGCFAANPQALVALQNLAERRPARVIKRLECVQIDGDNARIVRSGPPKSNTPRLLITR